MVALGALVVSLLALALLYGLAPYASGYGAGLVTILHFANTLWSGDNGDWQHCYLVPFAAAAMVYFKRRKLHIADLQTAWTGLGITVFGLFVYWLGFRADNVYLGYASFQILTGGVLLWLCGWKWTRHLFFAWAFLVFLYPVPFLDNILAFPLRMIMSQASVGVLNFLGVGAVKVGTAILSAPDELSGLKTGARFSVDVADPCSGIRSLFALMMVSALYGYFTQPGVWRKVSLFFCAIPLAVLGNLARILMLTIGTIAMGSETAIGSLDDPSFFHMLAGYLVFIVALAGLIGIGKLLNADWSRVSTNFRTFFESKPLHPPSRSVADKPTHSYDEY
jgi:exosortase